jgi:hypothetical protein
VAASVFTGTIENATNTAITNDDATSAEMYPTWVTANTGNLPQKTSSTKLTWNPSSGTLGATVFSDGTASLTAGAITGLVSIGTVVSAELEQLATIGATTISAQQWIGLGGLSATASEINTPLDGALVTLTEFQELETIGATTISANQWAALGGIAETLAAAELNILDGVTALTAELNYLDITTLGTGAASKAVVLDGSGNYTAPAGTWDLSGVTGITLRADEIIAGDISTDAVTMDAIDADGAFTSLTGPWATTGLLSGGVVTKSTAAAYTIGTTNAAESYGGVIYVTSAAVVTAPAVAAGMSFTVITIGAIAVSLDMNASDKMYLDGVL